MLDRTKVIWGGWVTIKPPSPLYKSVKNSMNSTKILTSPLRKRFYAGTVPEKRNTPQVQYLQIRSMLQVPPKNLSLKQIPQPPQSPA